MCHAFVKLTQLANYSKHSNVGELERVFWAVSMPDSPSYGKHMSLAEINEIVAPSAAAVDAVTEWLAAGHIEPSTCSWTASSSFVHCVVPLMTANECEWFIGVFTHR